ncbi:tRNA lysidine(34) synthetase TilS [Flavobacterium granuli]|uniref:tRNA(Ile)-lysidine synthase n=1 Tax=Flavobacterium granuli TaxID=280093 RepID=A0A1M5I0R8_9FLAO|nr:tRNA lysidine(34) synthetase TilS [Flavobacterium granuli]PRZ27726.1 tRNA(Ile)-lysidine synthase [Flavobacterium granuli]SHG21640.1 tRNA(Ile)-lysidine synthase [Flavobacterium granuli]
MLARFKKHIVENFQFLENKKLLLATSGGLDSMVMSHLFQQLNFDIALAHCNFQLRGLESFGDQTFVQEYAATNEIPLFVTQFDTEAFAKDYKLSTQLAARDLRYNWFYELLETENYDYVLTAHHADDNLETFLINLSRGTGLEGLVGIPEQNDKIIRPLLLFSREEIANYAAENTIQWREDSSNASDKYLRNKIRHDLVPLFKELNPQFIASFQKTQSYLQDAQTMLEDASIIVYQQLAKKEEDEIYFDLKQLKRLPNYKSYLYQWLHEFGFSSWNDVYDLVESQSGKQVFSADFRLLKDRDSLILSPIHAEKEKSEYFVNKNSTEVNLPLNLSFCKVSDLSLPTNTAIFVDEDQLEFPLVLKRWKQGDSFQPFGMEGKSKKVSKFFKDEKLSLIQKENSWILWSGNRIVWIVGLRQDERFRIINSTKNILKIELEDGSQGF